MTRRTLITVIKNTQASKLKDRHPIDDDGSVGGCGAPDRDGGGPIMMFLGRRIITTTLDPLPRLLRAEPGVLAVNHLERAALDRGDGDIFKMLADIVQAEDAADARLVLRPRIGKRKAKLDPSTRMSMLGASGAWRK